MQLAPINILVIEDNPEDVFFVRTILKKAKGVDFAIEAAGSLADGCRRLAAGGIQLVLLDLSLPDGSGLATFHELQSQAPEIPVIILSVVDDDETALRAVHDGAQDYLVKGKVDSGLLTRAIVYALERTMAKSALFAAEEKYRSIFENAVEGIFQTTPNGHYISVNPALARIYGYVSVEELMKSVTDIGRHLYVEAGRRDEFIRVMQEHGTVSDFESRIYRKDGSIIWISENARAVRAAGRRVLYYEGMVEDITRRKQAEATLRFSEERFRSIWENSNDGMRLTDPAGIVIAINSRFCEMVGMRIEEIEGRPFTVVYEDTPDNARILARYKERFLAGTIEQHFERHVRFKSGRESYTELSNSYIQREGQAPLLLSIFHDVTERKRFEEKVRNSEVLYHSLVETLPQNIFRKDLNDRFTFGNRRFCEAIGCQTEDLLGKTDFDFFPADLARKYQQDDRQIMASGKTFEVIEEYRPPGGETGYVQVVKTPLYDASGEIMGLQGIFWDITEKKRTEERERKANAELARSQEELRKKNEMLEDDLRMAQEIQQAILPQSYPVFPRDAAPGENLLSFHHRYQPTGEVGGDFFSVLPLSDTKAGVFICDVMGHGVRSALVTAMVRGLVEELKTVATDPGQLLTRVNGDLRTILQQTGTPLFTTAFYLVIDLDAREFLFANAGHPKPFMIRGDPAEVAVLKSFDGKSRPALGLFQESVYPTTRLPVRPGDRFMLFTDGLFEVSGPDNTEYSQEMLLAAVKKRAHLPAVELFDQLLAEIKGFALEPKFDDDVCLVAVDVSRRWPEA